MSSGRLVECASYLLFRLPGNLVRNLHRHFQPQLLHDLEEQPPLHSFATALDLAEEVFAHANNASGHVLA
ncbi:hypothetical protein D3C81_1730610 [compost metagenome]